MLKLRQHAKLFLTRIVKRDILLLARQRGGRDVITERCLLPLSLKIPKERIHEMALTYKRRGDYTDQEKALIEEVLERHRLYLMAKNDYKRFESCVGADKAAEVLCDLKRAHREDARNRKVAVREFFGRHKVLPGRRKFYSCKAISHIIDDARAYAKGSAVLKPLRNMKIHLLWCFFSLILLLIVAGYFLVAPWMNGVESAAVNSNTLIEILVVWLITFVLMLWSVKKCYEVIDQCPKPWLSCIIALILLYASAQYMISIPLGESDSQMVGAVGLSVVMLSIIWFILDCLAGLTPRNYFVGPEGFWDFFKRIRKGEFSLYFPFTASLCNTYVKKRTPEDYYRGAEYSALQSLLKKNRFILSNTSGNLEFHPSPSLKFIAAYFLTDIIHTGSIVAAIYGIYEFLVHHSANYSALAAGIAFTLVCVLLEHPCIITNRFHSHICKNLYAYRVSHLFRKLFYSIILLIFAGYMLQAV